MLFSKRIRIFFWIAMCVVAAIGVTVAVLIHRFQPMARDYVISTLRERYHSDVTLGDLQISLFPTVHATGENLELHFGGQPDAPPLVRVRRFTLEASFMGFFRSPKRIGKLTLEGTQIHVPPHSGSGAETGSKGNGKPVRVPFVLNEVVANGTTLESLPRDPSKRPLIFHIRELTLHSVGAGQAMTFHATLDNPKPPGFIHSDGKFGPWEADDPSATPLSGRYTFRDADLGVFRGITGTLSSDGEYKGRLAGLEVRGTTDTPNFALSTGQHPMVLHTQFQATVDGTNGNTVLHPVRAQLGDSNFEVSGSIDRGALEEHKTILLDAQGQGTRLQDFLRLAVSAPKPPMTGQLSFRTKVKIPPGKTDVVDRIQLNGSFALNSVMFTSLDVQDKIAGLSHRAEGHPEEHEPNVTAEIRGQFTLMSGTLRLPDLDFRVPGANIMLAGTYGLRSGALNFQGTARLQASVSDMTTGIKRILLKPIDPLFRRNGAGTVLPIEISGTRGSPSFHLDIGKVLRGK